MQQIKSIYVFAYTIGALLLSAYALMMLFTSGDGLWFGVLLTVLPPILMALWRRFLAVETGVDERESGVTALALIGLGVVLVGDAERGLLLLLAFCGVAGLLLHTFWASAIGARRGSPLSSGDVQALELYDAAGVCQRLGQWRGRRCLVLVLRGSWCPYSAVQLRRLAAAAADLNARDIAVVCIVAESPAAIADLVGEADIAVLQLRDEPPGTGLVLRGGVPPGLFLCGFGRDALRPGLMALDRAGELRHQQWADNYRLLPRHETALASL